jgi:Icc protein
MSRPFSFAHVSDFHVSSFGDTLHDRAGMVKRSARLADVSPAHFEEIWHEAGWRVLRDRAGRKTKIQLVDPDGYSHATPLRAEGASTDPVERAAEKAKRLEARRSSTLAKNLPTDATLLSMLAATPNNANLRFLRAARAMEADGVDGVILTGDITDDGVGYELVEAAFAKWIAKGRMFAVPGNHDLYLFPPIASTRPRATADSKKIAWRAFAKRIGLVLDPNGAWHRIVAEGECILVGLDSCSRSQRRFFRQNGAIGEDQLAYLAAIAKSAEWKHARHRLVALHHHVVPLPHGVGRGAPSEIGMRLDDAKNVAEIFDQLGVTMVLHGHRHVSEQRQPAGSNFRILASSSLTLGCRSGDAPSFWRIELAEHAHVTRVRIPVAAMEQENDPGSESVVASTD